jgi:hypothetical protein
MIRDKLSLVKSRVKDIIEFIRTGSIYDVTVAEVPSRRRRTLEWSRADGVRETGTYLEVYPFFGYVPQTVFVVIDTDGNVYKMAKGSTVEKLKGDHIYLGPLPEIPREWEISI